MSISLKIITCRLRFALVLLLSGIFSSNAETVLSREKISAWPPLGSSQSGPLVIDGINAFVPTTEGLLVADISNPADPRPLGKLPGKPVAVAVRGDFAYVADYDNGLEIYDVSNRESPTLVSRTPGPLRAQTLAVSGDYALFGSEGNLYIFNVADVTAPREVGRRGLGTPLDIKVVGRYAWVAAKDGGLLSVDFAGLATPKVVGGIEYWFVGKVETLATSGDYIFAASPGGLAVVSIADPVNPRIVGNIGGVMPYKGVAVSGNYLYTSGKSPDFEIYDITVPTAATRVYQETTGNSPKWIAVSGTQVYLNDLDAQIRILEVGTPEAPITVADFSGVTIAAELKTPYAFIADYPHGGLRVLDTTDLAHPRQVGFYKGDVQKILLSGNLVYAITAGPNVGSTLRAIDVSDPTNPTPRGSYVLGRPGLDLAANGAYLYVADEADGLVILDASDVANLKFLGKYVGTISSVAVSGSHVVVARDGNVIEALDVSNPASPVTVKSVTGTNTISAVKISGNVVLCLFEAGVQFFDISDPENLHAVGVYASLNPTLAGVPPVSDIAMKGQFAVLAMGQAGLDVVDFSDPALPRRGGQQYTHSGIDRIVDISIDGDFAAVAYNKRRFELLRINELPAEHPKRISSTQVASSAGRQILVAKGVGYIAVPDGLGILDLSVPTQPVLVKTVATAATRIAADGDLFCAAQEFASPSGIAVFSIVDPKNPQNVGNFFWNTTSYGSPTCTGLKVVGSHALFASQSAVFIFDLQNPSQPTIVGKYQSDALIQGVDAEGTIFCLSTLEGAEVVDWSSPSQPVKLSKYVDSHDYYAISMWKGRPYLMGSSGLDNTGMLSLDVADPRNPTASHSLEDAPHLIAGMTVIGGRAYLSDSGLQVIDLTATPPTWVGANIEDWRAMTPPPAAPALFRNYAYIAQADGNVVCYQLNSTPRLDLTRQSQSLTLRWSDRFPEYDLYEAPTPIGPWQKSTSQIISLDGFLSRTLQVDPGAMYFQLRIQ